MSKFIKFQAWEGQIEVKAYIEGNRALRLVDGEGPITSITVNPPPGTELVADELAIKNRSENEGMDTTLINLGIIQSAHRYIPSGFVQIPIHRVNEDILKQYLINS